MGRLIINGNQVYEIDEECLKNRKPPKSCDIWNDLKNYSFTEEEVRNSNIAKIKEKRDR